MPFDGGGVVVCGGICEQERTPLVIVNGNCTAQHYIDDIVSGGVGPKGYCRPVPNIHMWAPIGEVEIHLRARQAIYGVGSGAR